MTKTLVGNTHLIAGGVDTLPRLLDFLNTEGIATHANPDLYVRTSVSFGVDDAHQLRTRSLSRPLGAGPRVFIVCTSGMTTEAQNALLKTLEEPPADALFFFVVPSPETLLATIRSRAQVLVVAAQKGSDVIDVKEFLKTAPAQRIDLLKPLLEKNENEQRDLGAIIAFLSGVEAILGQKLPGQPFEDGLRAVYRARRYVADKGALTKPLLEQVALLVPVV